MASPTHSIFTLSLHDALPILVGLAILIAIPGEMVLSAVAGAGDTWGVLIIELLLSACVLAFAFSATMIFQLPLRSEEHTSELQSHSDLVCRLLLEKKKYIRLT